MNPLWHAGLFVIGQVVCALLGYYQGRKDEELAWRRIVGNLDKRTEGSPPWQP